MGGDPLKLSLACDQVTFLSTLALVLLGPRPLADLAPPGGPCLPEAQDV